METIGRLLVEFEGETSTHEYADRCSMLHDASELYCFDDCSDERVVGIYWGDREIYYVGWMPGMHYRFRYVDTKEIVYDAYYPEWDH